MHKYRVGVFGATGFSGVELVQLLARHPHVSIRFVASEQKAGRKFSELFGTTGNPASDSLSFAAYPAAEALCGEVDFVFLATPAEASRRLASLSLEAGARVIDLSGAFRLDDQNEALAHYGVASLPAPYGLPELNRSSLHSGTRLVANPGCYATAVALSLAPLACSELVLEDSFAVSAASGTTGAGRKTSEDHSYAQITGDLRAYRALTHQHQPEIQQVLTKLSQGRKIALSFVPHLAPFDRGILATSFFRTRKGVSEAEIRELFVARYAEEPFVHLADGPEDVRVHQVVGTNLCRIGWALDTASGRGVVVAALDNLLKGAAGQAVQNFNCLNGFLETEGLLGLRRTYS